MVAALEHLKSVAETGKSIFVCMLRLVAAKFVCGDVDAMVKDEILGLNPEQPYHQQGAGVCPKTKSFWESGFNMNRSSQMHLQAAQPR